LVALAFLHKNGIIHRDIKGENPAAVYTTPSTFAKTPDSRTHLVTLAANILITSMPNRVLLCDFGVSALLPSTASKRTTFIGTPYWMAPEVITTGASYDTKADIWSFGITILEMANGEPPMFGQPAERALAMITKQRAPRLEGGWSKEMKDFVVGCLNEEPADVGRRVLLYFCHFTC
jgi:protein-serine/threonine kinase